MVVASLTMLPTLVRGGRPLVLGCLSCLHRNTSTDAYSKRAVNMAYYSYENVPVNNMLHPLIIVHGLMGSKSNWQSLVKVFGMKGRRVIAVDVRNHGESAHVEDMDYFLLRDDLLRFMDEHSIPQALLLGHSMGGKICMTTALTHPERVSGLVVEDVAPMESPQSHKTPLFLQTMLHISLHLREMDGPLSSARKTALDMLSVVVHDEAVRHFLASNLVIEDDNYVWRCNLDAIINNYQHIAKFPQFRDEKYNGQALFIGGGKSDYISERIKPLIHYFFPNARIEQIAGAGHWVHSEKPREFIEIVNKFFTDISL